MLQHSKAVEGCCVLHVDRKRQGTKSSACYVSMCMRTHCVSLVAKVDGAWDLHRSMHGPAIATWQAIGHHFVCMQCKQPLPVLRLHCEDVGCCRVWVEEAKLHAQAGNGWGG